MSNPKPGYRTLRDIVQRSLFEDGESSQAKYALYKGFGIDFLRDYYLDSGNDVVTIKLPVDNLKRAKLPDDYIDYIKIGVQMGDHIKAFLRDDRTATIYDTVNCELVPNPPIGDEHDKLENDYQYGNYYFHNYVNSWGEHLGGFYGHGNGRIVGGFTLSDTYIHLSSTVALTDGLYLEYISSNMIYGEDTFLPIIAEQALKAYIRWQMIEHDRQAPLWSKQRANQQYAQAMRMTRARINKLTTEDITHIMRDNFKMSPKT